MTQTVLNFPNISSSKGCVLSHALAEEDPDNFGLLYTNKTQEMTNIFKNVCDECLLAKFGLRENSLKNSLENYPNCSSSFFNKSNSREIYEGPYLQACNVTNNSNNTADCVFPRNTVIIPCGQLLVDIMMSDFETLFNHSSIVPGYNLNMGVDDDTYGTINPYIYNYFRQIFYKIVCGEKKFQVKEANNLVDQICEQMKSTNKHRFSFVYRSEILKMGNIIIPTALFSVYVAKGQICLVNRDKQLKYNVSKYQTRTPDDLSQDKCTELKLVLKSHVKDIPHIQPLQIQKANSMAKTMMLPIRDEMIKNKQYLKNIFGDEPSAVLHFESYCISSIVTTNNSERIRDFLPNVEYIPCLGLISTQDICHGDYLVSEKDIKLDDLLKLKTNLETNEIQFEDPGDCTPIYDKVEKNTCLPRRRNLTRYNIHRFHHNF